MGLVCVNNTIIIFSCFFIRK